MLQLETNTAEIEIGKHYFTFRTSVIQAVKFPPRED